MDISVESFANFPVIDTKLMIPRLRAGIVRRPELITRINQGINSGTVLISAPAGFGKTTLLVEWASQCPFPVVWLSLDEQDNNPSVFIRYFFLAFQGILPDSFVSETGLPQRLDPQTELARIINGLKAANQPVALVLDDFHFITDQSILKGISYFLTHAPSDFHLLIASRSDPDIALARLRARDQLDELRATDLKFSQEESREFLQQTMKLDISDDETAVLENRTEGWITGLQLAAISLRHQSSIADLSGLISGDNTYILDFLVEEVFNQQSQEVQDFLLRTSILDNLTGPLCEAVAGLDTQPIHGQDLLHSFYHSNLFIAALDKEEHWFRYHPLFSESLRHLLVEKMPDDITALHESASAWYEQNGFAEEAIRHALAAHNEALAARIIEDNVEMVMKNGGILTILTWIKKLPEKLVKASPMLCIAYAWGLTVTFDIAPAGIWIREALNRLEQIKITSSLHPSNSDSLSEEQADYWLGRVYAVQSIVAALQGGAQKSKDLSQKALELLPEDDLFYRSFVALDQSVNYILDNDLKNAEEALKETIRLSQASGNWMVAMVALARLGETQASHGQASRALDTLKQSIPLTVDATGKPTGFIGHLYIVLGEVLLEQNHLQEAQDYITRGIELCKSWLPMTFEQDGHLHLAYLKQVLGDYAGAAREIETASQLASTTENEYDNLLVSFHEVKLALLRNDLRMALDWAEKNNYFYLETAEIKIPFAILAFIQINLARISLALSRREKNPEHAVQALAILQDLVPPLEARECVRDLIEVFTLKALAYQETGEMECALDALQKACQMGEPEGYRRIFLDEGLPLARLTSRLLARQKKKEKLSDYPSREFLLELISLFSTASQPGEDAVEAASPAGSNSPCAALREEHLIDLLTPREIEVLKLAAAGSTNAEIARHLCLSLNTVKRHLNNIFLKLGVATRTQAAHLARKLGLIE